MGLADETITLPDVIQVRRTLRASLTKLMDAQDYLAGQIAALDLVERQVRVLALRESSRALEEAAGTDALHDLGALQAETNANFRQMHATYAQLTAQIAALMTQHERLYNATFARKGGGSPPASPSDATRSET